MNKLLITAALGAALVSTPLLAQQDGGRGYGQRDQTRAEAQQRADMMFQMIDANHDGTVTKAEAQAKGRQMAIARKTEHKIQNQKGQIGERNSYGHDPFPPRG